MKVRATKTSLFFGIVLTLLLTVLFCSQDLGRPPNFFQSPRYHDERHLIEDIEDQLPNLPISYWNKMRRYFMLYNFTCAHFPNLFTMKFNNEHWQTLETSDGTFYLYNAYLDVRRRNETCVRILTMIDRVNLKVETFCQFWFKNLNRPVVVPVVEYKFIWYKKWGNNKNGLLQPYLLKCNLPENLTLYPIIVSLVEKPCDTSTVALKIIYNKASQRRNFAVCVKGLDFPYVDQSIRMAEWVELQLILGVDKIFFYDLGVHPNVKRLLDYYEMQGKVEVTRHMLPGDQPNLPLLRHFYINSEVVTRRQNELIPYNDCFYKHMYEYKYVVLLDIDEVIMPVTNNSLRDLMDTVESLSKATKKEMGFYSVQNVYFLDSFINNLLQTLFGIIPSYMHMLNHVYRARNFSKVGYYGKSFFNTSKVVSLHNHYPLHCIGYCNFYHINTTLARLQHYRVDCVRELKKTCQDFKTNGVEDKTIWKFKDVLIEAVTRTLSDLSLIPGSKR